MQIKPFPPMLPGESMILTAEEAKRINGHCQALHDDRHPTNNPSLAEGYYLPKGHPDHPFPTPDWQKMREEVAVAIYLDKFSLQDDPNITAKKCTNIFKQAREGKSS